MILGGHARMVKIFETVSTAAFATWLAPDVRLVFRPCTQQYSPSMSLERTEGERRMDWKTLLVYITGTVDQELLLRNEYLVTENRILRHQITGRVRLTNGERKTLAEIGKKLGKQALEEVASLVKPETILAWHRKLMAQKFDGSKPRKAPGRPTIDQELEALVVRMAQENRRWGYEDQRAHSNRNIRFRFKV